MPGKSKVTLPDIPSSTGEPSNIIADVQENVQEIIADVQDNVQDIIETIKQSPWTRPVILGTVGVILVTGGVYYAVKKQGGGSGSGFKLPWTSKTPVKSKATNKPANKSWWSWK